MDKTAKRAAVAAYKERKTQAGVFAVRCTASGEVWVGATPTLDTIQTRLWFGFRQGASRPIELQNAWKQHGEASFSFEPLETYDEESATLMQREWLKDRAAHWRQTLGAKVI